MWESLRGQPLVHTYVYAGGRTHLWQVPSSLTDKYPSTLSVNSSLSFDKRSVVAGLSLLPSCELSRPASSAERLGISSNKAPKSVVGAKNDEVADCQKHQNGSRLDDLIGRLRVLQAARDILRPGERSPRQILLKQWRHRECLGDDTCNQTYILQTSQTTNPKPASSAATKRIYTHRSIDTPTQILRKDQPPCVSTSPPSAWLSSPA